MNFDPLGYLTPTGKHTIPIADFRSRFVEAFDQSSTRLEIFNGYIRYLNELKGIIGNIAKLTQWIDGSFVTSKLNPGDIDLVSFLDNQIVEKYEDRLQALLSSEARKAYCVDGYVVRVYPQYHPNHFRTISDIAYWNDWFGRTKPNQNRKRYQKGYIEIKHISSSP